jgi:ubiquinone/menaquinone biosynthesis C-methylase UbiE
MKLITANSDLLSRATARLSRKYNLVGPIYDLLEWPSERLVLAEGRTKLFQKVPPGTLLEVGIGTGKNIPFYPDNVSVTAIDISKRMIERARKRAQRLERKIHLKIMDMQNLPFPDASFDTVVGTLVFCTVPAPRLALKEIKRVLKPGGRLVILEHGRPNNKNLATLFTLLSRFTVTFWGDHLNREMVPLLDTAGFVIEEVENISRDFWKLIVAGPNHQNNY